LAADDQEYIPEVHKVQLMVELAQQILEEEVAEVFTEAPMFLDQEAQVWLLYDTGMLDASV
jgi:hypothetical protein